MIIPRIAQQCGHADYGWLKARYTFSFGHYFDPKLMGYAALRVLNQDVLAPGATFQPRSFPDVDILNLVLEGIAEYRDSRGQHISARPNHAVLISAQPHTTYSEHNTSDSQSLTRMQLWFDACPARDNPAQQSVTLTEAPCQLLASPDGAEGSLILRQQVWVHHVQLAKDEQMHFALRGPRAYIQSIQGNFQIAEQATTQTSLRCGDGAFIRDEASITLIANSPLRALLIDLAL